MGEIDVSDSEKIRPTYQFVRVDHFETLKSDLEITATFVLRKPLDTCMVARMGEALAYNALEADLFTAIKKRCNDEG